MALLARVADRLYWGARYVERAEDTARIVGAFSELIIDLPITADSRWLPLVTITGSAVELDDTTSDGHEDSIIGRLVIDRSNPGSIASCIESSRANLRGAREVMPREAWRTVNSLSQFVEAASARAVQRSRRDAFLTRVIDDSRRLDGVLESTMTRDNTYRMWRLGRLIERADMTTRVLGVAAASLLQQELAEVPAVHDEVQWMGVLRSLSALQMYQRHTRGPIEARSVVDFLLFHSAFPRSVRGCLDEIRTVLSDLPDPHKVIAVLDGTAEQLVGSSLRVFDADPSDGAALDGVMDALQVALESLGSAITARYVDAAAL